ncbi:MAG: DUF4320 family protein [Lawsonibacter sp.]|nr:DUF4320 family protein [Lawsonibacter sp.]
MNKLKETRGEFSLNGSLILLLVFACLALAISVLGVANRSMKLHTMASELMRYTEVRGQVDSAVYGELDRLKDVTGMDANCTITANYLSGTTKVQFGEPITVCLEYPVRFGIGGVLSVPMTLRATVAGRSELYWK